MLKIKKNQSDSISKLDNAPISTVLGSETMFTGDIQGSQTIKIDGKVKGNIQVENGVILGEKAQIEGDLKSKNILSGNKLTILCEVSKKHVSLRL